MMRVNFRQHDHAKQKEIMEPDLYTDASLDEDIHRTRHNKNPIWLACDLLPSEALWRAAFSIGTRSGLCLLSFWPRCLCVKLQQAQEPGAISLSVHSKILTKLMLCRSEAPSKRGPKSASAVPPAQKMDSFLVAQPDESQLPGGSNPPPVPKPIPGSECLTDPSNIAGTLPSNFPMIQWT